MWACRKGRGGEGSAQEMDRGHLSTWGWELRRTSKRAWRERRDAEPPRQGREGTSDAADGPEGDVRMN